MIGEALRHATPHDAAGHAGSIAAALGALSVTT
jgi:hypothetical protein